MVGFRCEQLGSIGLAQCLEEKVRQQIALDDVL